MCYYYEVVLCNEIISIANQVRANLPNLANCTWRRHRHLTRVSKHAASRREIVYEIYE